MKNLGLDGFFACGYCDLLFGILKICLASALTAFTERHFMALRMVNTDWIWLNLCRGKGLL